MSACGGLLLRARRSGRRIQRAGGRGLALHIRRVAKSMRRGLACMQDASRKQCYLVLVRVYYWSSWVSIHAGRGGCTPHSLVAPTPRTYLGPLSLTEDRLEDRAPGRRRRSSPAGFSAVLSGEQRSRLPAIDDGVCEYLSWPEYSDTVVDCLHTACILLSDAHKWQ